MHKQRFHMFCGPISRSCVFDEIKIITNLFAIVKLTWKRENSKNRIHSKNSPTKYLLIDQRQLWKWQQNNNTWLVRCKISSKVIVENRNEGRQYRYCCNKPLLMNSSVYFNRKKTHLHTWISVQFKIYEWKIMPEFLYIVLHILLRIIMTSSFSLSDRCPCRFEVTIGKCFLF